MSVTLINATYGKKLRLVRRNVLVGVLILRLWCLLLLVVPQVRHWIKTNIIVSMLCFDHHMSFIWWKLIILRSVASPRCRLGLTLLRIKLQKAVQRGLQAREKRVIVIVCAAVQDLLGLERLFVVLVVRLVKLELSPYFGMIRQQLILSDFFNVNKALWIIEFFLVLTR